MFSCKTFKVLKSTLILGCIAFPFMGFGQVQFGAYYQPTFDKNVRYSTINHGLNFRFKVPIKEPYAVNFGVGYEDRHFILQNVSNSTYRYLSDLDYHSKLHKVTFSVEKKYEEHKYYIAKTRLGCNVNQLVYLKTKEDNFEPIISETTYLESVVLQLSQGVDVKLGSSLLLQIEPTMHFVLPHGLVPYWMNQFRFSLNVGVAMIMDMV